MELEDMKRQWSQLSAHHDNLDKSITPEQLGKNKTAQQQLIRKYRCLAIVCAMFIITTGVTIPRITDNWWLGIACMAYFAICTIMELVMQHKVGEIELATMPVSEVATKAAACRRLHHIFQLILIPFALLLLGSMAYVMSSDEAFLYGMAGGALIGIVIGFINYFRFMDNYKLLINQ